MNSFFHFLYSHIFIGTKSIGLHYMQHTAKGPPHDRNTVLIKENRFAVGQWWNFNRTTNIYFYFVEIQRLNEIGFQHLKRCLIIFYSKFDFLVRNQTISMCEMRDVRFWIVRQIPHTLNNEFKNTEWSPELGLNARQMDQMHIRWTKNV